MADERLHNAKVEDDAKALKKAEADYELFLEQWKAVDAVLEEVGEAFKGMEQTRRTLVEETTKNIAKLGVAK